MKGGIAAFIAALSTLKVTAGSGLPTGWKIKIALLADEEFWSFGAVALLGGDFLNDVKLALVPEISEAGCESDVQWIGLGRLGRSEFVFDITGHACHGADAFVHPDAVNAVHEAAKLEVEIIRYCEKIRSDFSVDGISVTNSAYLNLHQGGKGILSVPDKASFTLDRSLVPGESADKELDVLNAVVRDAVERKAVDPRVQIKVFARPRPTPANKPYFLEPKSLPVRFVTAAVEKVCSKIEYGIGRSVADENRIADIGIPTLILAPNGGGSHTSQEWVDGESLYRLRDIFVEVIKSLGDFFKMTAARRLS